MDIRIVSECQGGATDPEVVTLDLLLAPSGDLATGDDLATAVTVALLTDGLAEPDELLFEHDGDRRGWWADQQAGAIWNAAPIGSRLWLLEREKATESTRTRAERYIREALQPLADIGAIAGFDVALERSAVTAITGEVAVYRDGRQPIAQRFEIHWDGVRA